MSLSSAATATVVIAVATAALWIAWWTYVQVGSWPCERLRCWLVALMGHACRNASRSLKSSKLRAGVHMRMAASGRTTGVVDGYFR